MAPWLANGVPAPGSAPRTAVTSCSVTNAQASASAVVGDPVEGADEDDGAVGGGDVDADGSAGAVVLTAGRAAQMVSA
jgi:hypothetical protein